MFRKASKTVFNEKFSANSVKGQFERSMKIYQWIVAFEKFTGGGGDGDLYDSDADADLDDEDRKQIAMAAYKSRLEGAHEQSFNVGSLSPKVIDEWYANGWYDLFNSRSVDE